MKRPKLEYVVVRNYFDNQKPTEDDFIQVLFYKDGVYQSEFYRWRYGDMNKAIKVKSEGAYCLLDKFIADLHFAYDLGYEIEFWDKLIVPDEDEARYEVK